MNKTPTSATQPAVQIQKRATVLIVAAVINLLLCIVSAQAQAGSQPTRFEFFFNGPARGMRTWERNGDTWTETYSSGQKGVFKGKKAPYRFRGITGALVQKVDEPDFFVFIPNLDSAKMEVWTYKAKGPWLFLAKMKDIQPGRID
jgi:hypothetical protein